MDEWLWTPGVVVKGDPFRRAFTDGETNQWTASVVKGKELLRKMSGFRHNSNARN
jgi:hypothetical protein